MIISTISAIPFTAYALDASGTCGDNATYTFDSSTGTVTISGTGSTKDYTSVYSPFTNDAASVKSVIIEDGITRIGAGLFEHCTNLTKVTIGNTVTAIARYAFNDCTALKRVTIPSSVTNIYFQAFNNCTALNTVVYMGAETQWNAITVDSGNDVLASAEKYYMGCGENAYYSLNSSGELSIKGTGDTYD